MTNFPLPPSTTAPVFIVVQWSNGGLPSVKSFISREESTRWVARQAIQLQKLELYDHVEYGDYRLTVVLKNGVSVLYSEAYHA